MCCGPRCRAAASGRRLFWEWHNVVTLTLDDNSSRTRSPGSIRAGIRVTSGERGVYANGNVNDGDDLLAIAGRAAAGSRVDASKWVTLQAATIIKHAFGEVAN